jgi:opacity protein-like surface antigen
MKNIKRIIIAALLTSAVAAPVHAAKLIPAVEPTSAPTATQAVATPVPPSPARVIIAAAPAETPNAATRTAPKSSAFYLGAQVGNSTIGAFMGYQLSKMYAMEISYDYVDPVYTATTILEVARVGASAIALFPIKFSEMGPMSIYIKVGYARTTENYTIKDPGVPGIYPPTTSITTTLKTGVTGGAGVNVDLSSNTTARLGGNYVGGDRSVYLAAIYKF